MCRRDAHLFAKHTVGRGAGNVMAACDPGLLYDAGLRFEPCDPGYTGVSFVCWGQCPTDYDDHGATCYRAPNVLTKY